MLIKRPEVEFCGYSIPHPSENFMNLRLQTIGNQVIIILIYLEKNSNDVLKAGLKDLAQLCDIIENKFDDAVAKYQKKASKQK
jgi:DNA-directed RNA polymerase, subunit L